MHFVETKSFRLCKISYYLHYDWLKDFREIFLFALKEQKNSVSGDFILQAINDSFSHKINVLLPFLSVWRIIKSTLRAYVSNFWGEDKT
jgi:hypothetical protein